MSLNEKSSKPNELCKGHAARENKDFYRLCPSKLNKRELEDLYYSLLDKNLELKREINVKNEKIRTLSTKVQRLSTSNKPHTGKDCCQAAKTLISEQKASIADLKKANDVMTERIKRLNVKLCTAKQFLKQGSQLNNNRPKSITGPSHSSRNLSSGLVAKASTDNIRSTAVSARPLVSEPPETKTVGTNSEEVGEEIKPEKQETEKLCTKSQCKSAVEEFKNRISDLKEELLRTHTEYSSRMNHLERKVSQLLTSRYQDDYAHRLHSKEAEHLQVIAERNKVAEMEMRLKSANMSQDVANTIAEHLNNANKLEERRASQIEKLRNGATVNGGNHGEISTPHPGSLSPVPESEPGKSSELTAPDDGLYKSDDSGYAEIRRDNDQEENFEKNNQELVKKIAYLQAQLDDIKMSANNQFQPTREPEATSAKRDSYDVIIDELSVPVLKNVKDYNCYIVDPEKKVIIEIEHVNKDAAELYETFDRDLTKNGEETKDIGGPESQKREPKDIGVPESQKREPKENGVIESQKREPKDISVPESQKWEPKDGVPESQKWQSKDIRVPEYQKREPKIIGVPESQKWEPKDNGVIKSLKLEPKGIGVPEYQKREPKIIGVPESQKWEPKDNGVIGSQKREPKDIGVPESQKREPINECSLECSVKPHETNFQQSDTINEERHFRDAGITRTFSRPSQDLQKIEERFNVHKTLCEISMEEANKKQPNDPSQAQTQNVEKDKSVSPKTQGGKHKKCNKVICECPKEKEPLKVIDPASDKEENNETYKILPRYSIDDTNAYKPMQNVSTPKSDRHNSMQIPGPLPMATSKRDSNASKTSNSSMKSKLQHFQGRKASNGFKEKSGSSEGKESYLTKNEFAPTHTNKGDVNATNTKPVNNSNTRVAFENKDTALNEPFHHEKNSFENHPVNDMRHNNELSDKTAYREDVNQQCDVQNEKATEMKAAIGQCLNQSCNSYQVNDKIQPRLASQQSLHNHPSMRIREQIVVRSNSGTITVLSSEEKKSRATSPANTDYEISHMSDLPTEKDGTSVRMLSPGEHKATTTTDSFTPYNDSSLSEGEVPNRYAKRTISVSVGELTDNKSANNDGYQSSSEKMEAALQMITLELAKCRALLETQRSREQRSSVKDAATAAESPQKEFIALRKSEALSRMTGTIVPKCIFTLHIGTIVLSDEAVINTRTIPLMLTWRFFNQNVVMTRMAPGRVVHFDFSTEYAVKINEDFIRHLKYEEMPISICEIDENQTTFAICWLPLREAVLNANRRVDISLGLVAHPHLKRKTDEFDLGDEIGTIDLWCMLRADSEDLAFIRRAFDTTSMNRAAVSRPSQNIKDDLYYDYRNSLDADLLSRLKRRKTVEQRKSGLQFNVDNSGGNMNYYSPECEQNTSQFDGDKNGANKHYYAPRSRHQSIMETAGVEKDCIMIRHRTKEDHNDTSITSDLGLERFEIKKELGPEFRRSPFRESIMSRNAANEKSGGVIMTEITPKARSPEEMKYIWETNNALNKSDQALPNMDRRLTTTKICKKGSTLSQEAVKGIPKQEPGTTNKFRDKSSVSWDAVRRVSYAPTHRDVNEDTEKAQPTNYSPNPLDNKLEITVLWLTLDEECEAMRDPLVRRLYVAYSFLGRDGAELETPISLPKPKHYGDKCFFNFHKTFYLTEFDIPILDHMAKCRSQNRVTHNSKDCIMFSVVSEPPEDPLGLDNCEDIGYAFMYLGDELAYSMGDSFMEVLPVSCVKKEDVCGMLAVRLDGLDGLRARVGRTQ